MPQRSFCTAARKKKPTNKRRKQKCQQQTHGDFPRRAFRPSLLGYLSDAGQQNKTKKKGPFAKEMKALQTLMWWALVSTPRLGWAFTTRKGLYQSLLRRRPVVMSGRGFGSMQRTPDKPDKLPVTASQTQSLPPKRVIDDTVQFPTRFMMKFIGINDPTFVQDIVSVVAMSTTTSSSTNSTQITSTTMMDDLQVSVKENGKYLSITVNPHCTSASVVYQTYEDVARDVRVKFML
jgi:putative lipoic acid-binding regulatory protein